MISQHNRFFSPLIDVALKKIQGVRFEMLKLEPFFIFLLCISFLSLAFTLGMPPTWINILSIYGVFIIFLSFIKKPYTDKTNSLLLCAAHAILLVSIATISVGFSMIAPVASTLVLLFILLSLKKTTCGK